MHVWIVFDPARKLFTRQKKIKRENRFARNVKPLRAESENRFARDRYARTTCPTEVPCGKRRTHDSATRGSTRSDTARPPWEGAPFLTISKEHRPVEFFERVGHRKMGDQKASPSGHKIPTGLPEGGVSTSKSRNFTSE